MMRCESEERRNANTLDNRWDQDPTGQRYELYAGSAMAVVIPIDSPKQQKQLQRKTIAAQSSTEDCNKPRSASNGASTLLRASAFQFKATGSAPTGIR
jgi:hypothetical protein